MGKDLKGKELGKGFSQRKNGTYVARYVNLYGERKSIYNKDLRELKREYATATANNTLGNAVLNEDMTLTQWFHIWMSAYKDKFLREDSKLFYTLLFTHHIEPYLGDQKFSSISKVQCVKLLNLLKEKELGWESLNKVRIVISDMYNRGMEDNFALKNPMKGVRLPVNRPRNERRILEKTEQALFFECSAGTFYNNLFEVAINTGLRPGEVFALTMRDIDFDASEITVSKTLVYQKYLTDTKKEFHIEPPKTETSNRKVPINKKCAIALKKQAVQKYVIEQRMGRNEQFPDLLFVTPRNNPINSQILSDAIKRILNEVNSMLLPIEQIEQFSGHCFRHTFATRAIESGVSPKTLQKYLGHATLKMTMDLYVHVTDDTRHSEMKKIETALDEISVDTENIEKKFEQYKDNKEKIVYFDTKIMA